MLLLALLAGVLAMHGLSSPAAAAAAQLTLAPSGAAHGSAAPLPPPAGGADHGHHPYDLLQPCLIILCGVAIVALLLAARGRLGPASWLGEQPRSYVGVLPSCRPPPRGRPRISLCVLRT